MWSWDGNQEGTVDLGGVYPEWDKEDCLENSISRGQALGEDLNEE